MTGHVDTKAVQLLANSHPHEIRTRRISPASHAIVHHPEERFVDGYREELLTG